MKKVLLIISFATATIYAGYHFVNKKNDLKNYSPQGEVEDTKARMKWVNARLADPATGKIPSYIRHRELAYAATLPTDANILGKLTGASNSFVARGPNNLGGRTRCIAIDVTDENVMLSGSVSGGVFRSTNGGATWTKVSQSNSFQGVVAIVQDKRPGHTNNWYYQSGEGYGTSASGGGAFFLGNGLYKSVDGGLTWSGLTATNNNSPQSFNSAWEIGWNMAFDNSDTINDKLYAAIYGAVYKSLDGGINWSPAIGSAANQSYFSDVAVTTTGAVYATLSSDGGTKGVFRSQGGTSFTNILPANFPVNYDRIVIGIDPNNENIVYFFGVTPGAGKYTFYFGDEWNSLWKYEYVSGTGQGAGGIWTDLSQNLPDYGTDFNVMATQSGYDMAVSVKPGNSNVIFVAGTNIYRSTSGFTDNINTTLVAGYQASANLPFVFGYQYEYPGQHSDQHAMVFLPSNPDVMFSAHDAGISKSLDNTVTPMVWSRVNDGYITSQFYTVAIDHNVTSDIIVGGLQDNGTYYTNSTNITTPWTHTFGGDGAYSAIGSGGYYYLSQNLGKTIKATVAPNGNVINYARIDPIGGADYQWVNPFVIDPNDNNIMYFTAGRKLYRNSDLSAIPLNNTFDSISTNWTYFPDTLTASGEEITALAVSTVPANRLYYGTNKRKIFRIDNANTGSPSSTVITIPSNVLPSGSAYVSCIAVNPNDADELMVVLSNYNIYSLAFSRDGGLTWARCGGNLEQTASGSGNGPSCRWATIMPVSDGTVYMVGTSVGLFATDTLVPPATVWVQQGANTIGSNVVDMMDYRQGDGLIAVATHGNGMFSAYITSTGNIATVNDLKAESISMNLYPNPANSQLNVTFDKQLDSRNLKISIVNEAGAIVKILNPNAIVSGKLTTDISELRNGIYYLNVNNRKQKFSKSFIKMN